MANKKKKKNKRNNPYSRSKRFNYCPEKTLYNYEYQRKKDSEMIAILFILSIVIVLSVIGVTNGQIY